MHDSTAFLSVSAVLSSTRTSLIRRPMSSSRDMPSMNVIDAAPPLEPSACRLSMIGVEHAGQLLVTAGDNPERLRSEAAFARLCGVFPIPAPSGGTR